MSRKCYHSCPERKCEGQTLDWPDRSEHLLNKDAHPNCSFATCGVLFECLFKPERKDLLGPYRDNAVKCMIKAMWKDTITLKVVLVDPRNHEECSSLQKAIRELCASFKDEVHSCEPLHFHDDCRVYHEIKDNEFIKNTTLSVRAEWPLTTVDHELAVLMRTSWIKFAWMIHPDCETTCPIVGITVTLIPSSQWTAKKVVRDNSLGCMMDKQMSTLMQQYEEKMLKALGSDQSATVLLTSESNSCFDDLYPAMGHLFRRNNLDGVKLYLHKDKCKIQGQNASVDDIYCLSNCQPVGVVVKRRDDDVHEKEQREMIPTPLPATIPTTMTTATSTISDIAHVHVLSEQLVHDNAKLF